MGGDVGEDPGFRLAMVPMVPGGGGRSREGEEVGKEEGASVGSVREWLEVGGHGGDGRDC